MAGVSPHYDVVDSYNYDSHAFDHDSSAASTKCDNAPRLFQCIWRAYAALQEPRIAEYILLMCVGLASAVVTLCSDVATFYMLAIKKALLDLTPYYPVQSVPIQHFALSHPWHPPMPQTTPLMLVSPAWFLLWITFALTMSVFAAACVHYISPFCAGSGIPDMKCVLSGIAMPESLTLRTILGKFLGLVAAQSAGLSVGKEGPFVHLCSGLCHQILRIPLFSKLRVNPTKRLQITPSSAFRYGAACAAGVAATFGAPIGGVLFSIEVTSRFYLVSNLWKGVLTATIVSYLMYIWRMSDPNSPEEWISLFSTCLPPISKQDNTFRELIVFVALGVLCGFAGVFFNASVKVFVHWRNTWEFVAGNRYRQVLIVAFLTAVVCFPLDPMLRQFQNDSINDLFSNPSPLERSGTAGQNSACPQYVFFRYILTTLAIILPIPCGLFTPVFALGAGLGRLLGEVVGVMFPTWGILAGGYAVAGAAALTASVTQTLSTAVILFELTAQLSHMLPVLMAVSISYWISTHFTISIYDVMLQLRKLPYLPDYSHLESSSFRDKTEDILAKDAMRKGQAICVLQLDPTLEAVTLALQNNRQVDFPVVASLQDPVLVGYVWRAHLHWALDRCMGGALSISAPSPMFFPNPSTDGSRLSGHPAMAEYGQRLYFSFIPESRCRAGASSSAWCMTEDPALTDEEELASLPTVANNFDSAPDPHEDDSLHSSDALVSLAHPDTTPSLKQSASDPLLDNISSYVVLPSPRDPSPGVPS
eukprot:gene8376-1495_t